MSKKDSKALALLFKRYQEALLASIPFSPHALLRRRRKEIRKQALLLQERYELLRHRVKHAISDQQELMEQTIVELRKEMAYKIKRMSDLVEEQRAYRRGHPEILRIMQEEMSRLKKGLKEDWRYWHAIGRRIETLPCSST